MENTEFGMHHTLIVDNRRSMQITGVTEVESFDEQAVILVTGPGELIIKGNSLHITKIDVGSGNLSLEGDISEIAYGDPRPAGSLLSRLFR